jgi:uncharacterized protein
MRKIAVFIFLFMWLSPTWSQKDCFPPKNENQLVYDLTQTLSPQEQAALENNLDTFAANTSNQIVIIITNELCGWEPSEYSFRMMDQWGIGQADLDNGIVILIKPKTAESKGQAFIATGRGLEGALPDGKVHFIWEKEMIPSLKQNQYFQGISNAVNVIESIIRKEYNIDTYAKKGKKKKDFGGWVGLLIFGAVLIFMMFSQGRAGARQNNLPFWTAFWLMNSQPRRGYWNDFHSRGNDWGGGGFGGFGGGSSGGGGSGGSW